MEKMISTDKPVFYQINTIEHESCGEISVCYYESNEKKVRQGALEYGAVSGRLFKMEFKSKDELKNNINCLKELYLNFLKERTSSMRRKDNSLLAKRIVEKIFKLNII